MAPSDVIRHMHEMDKFYTGSQIGFALAGSLSGGLVIIHALTGAVQIMTVLLGITFGASTMAYLSLGLSRRMGRASCQAIACLMQANNDAMHAMRLMAEERDSMPHDVPSISPGRTIN